VVSLLLLLGATGKLIESRFGRRGAYDSALVCFTVDLGGGGCMAKCSLLSEVPT
jgi:hypothetical protein